MISTFKKLKDRLIRWSNFSRLTNAFASEASLVFVVSAPRSGSTWLERSLNAHPEIYATENRFFGQFCENWPDDEHTKSPRVTLDAYVRAWFKVIDRSNMRGWLPATEDRAFGEFARHVLRMERRMSGKRIIVDKITPYLGTADDVLIGIKKFFPKAKLIHLHRDGRDVCTSGVFDWIKKKDIGTDRYRKFALGENVAIERFFTDEDIKTWARYWKEPIQAWTNTGISPDCTISYEAMKEDYDAVLNNIFDTLNLKNTPAIREACIKSGSFEKLSGGRKAGEGVATAKARKGVSGDWRNHFTRHDAELFENLTHGLLADVGYVNNSAAWIEETEINL
jgi:LPS sulfotransferase NodH